MRLHLTNIHGLGATVLVESLLPALIEIGGDEIEEIYVSEGSRWERLLPVQDGRMSVYRRYAFKPASRLVEVLFRSGRFGGSGPIIVLGDIPIRGLSRQLVFVHTPFIIDDTADLGILLRLKFGIQRAVFRLNLGSASRLVVQTHHMAEGLVRRYGVDENKVTVLPQPVPGWLQGVGHSPRRPGEVDLQSGLRLFYPARAYRHKNHALLGKIDTKRVPSNFIQEIILTIPSSVNPNSAFSPLRCVGEIPHDQVRKMYERTHALLFPSLSESYGLPLVEAMYLGLPIVCSDLPYARELCGDEAFYFDPEKPSSLMAALSRLRDALERGWTPSWKQQLRHTPTNWHDLALRLLSIARTV
mgnify:CR=1 FL=1